MGSLLELIRQHDPKARDLTVESLTMILDGGNIIRHQGNLAAHLRCGAVAIASDVDNLSDDDRERLRYIHTYAYDN